MITTFALLLSLVIFHLAITFTSVQSDLPALHNALHPIIVERVTAQSGPKPPDRSQNPPPPYYEPWDRPGFRPPLWLFPFVHIPFVDSV